MSSPMGQGWWRGMVARRSGILTAVALGLILIMGGYFRLTGLDWDSGQHIQPDERFVTMVATDTSLPSSLAQYFDSTSSPLNPFNRNQPNYPYGTSFLFLAKFLAGPTGMEGYDRIVLLGRMLSVLFDLGTVVLVFLLGCKIGFVSRARGGLQTRPYHRWVGHPPASPPADPMGGLQTRPYHRWVGLAGAFLYAASVLPIQYSHFFVAESSTTFFVALTLFLAVRVSRDGGWPDYLGMGLACGLALASKVSVALIIPVMAVAAGLAYRTRPGARPALGLALAMVGTVLAFRLAQPYAFAGAGFLDLRPSFLFLQNVETQRRMADGSLEFPYTLQWAGTLPYIFPLQNLFWGLGPTFLAAALGGAALAVFQLVRERRLEHLLLLLWVGLAFVYFGGQMVKYMRYLLPIYPFLALLAGYLLVWVVERGTRNRERGTRNKEQGTRHEERGEGSGFRVPGSAASFLDPRPSSLGQDPTADPGPWTLDPRPYPVPDPGPHILDPRPHPVPDPGPSTLDPRPYPVPRSLFLVPAALVLLGTFLWAWAFTSIYARPLTRVEASTWILQNVPAGAAVAVEHWDDPLPFNMRGVEPRQYRQISMELYNDDNPAKLSILVAQLNAADYIFVSSNRLYGAIPRLPLRYPMTIEYYRLLFAGDLGFQKVRTFTSYPSLGPLELVDDSADEAFTVYDHPKVILFKKSDSFSLERVQQLLSAVPLDSVVRQSPRDVSVNALQMSPDLLQANRAGGTWNQVFDPQGLPSRFPFISWYLLVQVLSLAALPLGMAALGRLPDGGYPLFKTLGILLVAYLSWVAASLRLAPYTQATLLAALVLIAFVSALLLWRNWAGIRDFTKREWRLILATEVLFLAAFAAFYFIRLADPDLWHPFRGGEKPMDLAYLNAVAKSTYFPPYDPWFSGGYINYYYFGQVLVASLSKLTTIPTNISYNLAVPLFFALTVLGAFSAGYNLLAMARLPSPQRRGGRGDEKKEGTLGGPGDLGGENGGSEVAQLDSPQGSGGRGDEKKEGTLGGPGDLGGENGGSEVAQLDSPQGSGGRGEDEKGGALRSLGDLGRGTKGIFSLALAGGLAAALLVAVAGNLDGLVQLVLGLWKINPHPFETSWPGASGLVNAWLGLGEAIGGKSLPVFDFWRSSRMMSPSFSITEFPYFTFLFADLHAHLIVLPFTLLALGFIISLAVRSTLDSRLSTLVLFPLVLGALWVINSWDFPTYLLMSGAVLLMTQLRQGFNWPALGRAALLVAGLFAASYLLYYPFHYHYQQFYLGVIPSPEKTPILQYLGVYGVFILIIGGYLVSRLKEGLRRAPGGALLLAPAVVLLLGILAALLLSGLPTAAFLVFMLALALLALAASDDRPSALAVIMVIAALAVGLGVEFITIKGDIQRMNTVFKFYLQAWVLMGVASAYCLVMLLRVWNERGRFWPGYAWSLLVAVALWGALIYPVSATPVRVADRFTTLPATDDGMAFMGAAKYGDEKGDSDVASDYRAIKWMQENIQGSPVVLEGNTPLYHWGSRVSIYTGLPAVIGWDWHEKQQRAAYHDRVDSRLADVGAMYSTTDQATLRRLLQKYGVSYVYVGQTERNYYPASGLAKFEALDGTALRRVYQEGAVTIYEVLRT